jgi:hypothetical protein
VKVRALASSSAGQNHQEIFTVASAGALMHSWWSGENWWSEWVDMSTPDSGGYGRIISIASHSRAYGHQELFVAYERGPVFHRWRWDDSGWSDWYEFCASEQVGALSSCGASREHQEVFALTGDRRLVHARYGPA